MCWLRKRELPGMPEATGSGSVVDTAGILRQSGAQDYRSRAQTELVQARQNLSLVTADRDALRQKSDQQAADLGSSNKLIRDLQADMRRANNSEKARLLGDSISSPLDSMQRLHCFTCDMGSWRDHSKMTWKLQILDMSLEYG